MKKPVLLCILDGLGLNPEKFGNAVAQAITPNLDRLMQEHPFTTLRTDGEAVGLPEGQMGNSEVGHLNIGAGRVVEQWLVRIKNELASGECFLSESYLNFLKSASPKGTLHLVGLYSDGGVHSHEEHLWQLLDKLEQYYPGKDISVHLITDGRDVSPTSAAAAVSALELKLKSFKRIKIASVSGRFYAMDRDQRWERVEEAYRCITGHVDSSSSLDPSEYIKKCYEEGTTDEFLKPESFVESAVQPEDSVLFWNFRSDRMREIVHALCDPTFNKFTRESPVFSPERVLCFTQYDESFPYPVLFRERHLTSPLGEIVSNANMTQFRSAETEKYPHVTFFLNGGRDEPYPGEERALIPSPREIDTYDKKPEMSAEQVCKATQEAIESRAFDLLVVNFANCDMVGHTGVFDAAVKAVEVVDSCLGKLLGSLESVSGQAIIIADHGNAEQMMNPDGSPQTAHTTFPVPCILFGNSSQLRSGGALCDVAPSLLKLLGLKQASAMTGRPLF
jgi:2,3-bisphosphoglycerate-independent phosphoglycerate mutase